MQSPSEQPASWLDSPAFGKFKLSWETIIILLILALGVFTRFYKLEARVMSHDEMIHVYYNGWSLFSGQGYRHDPLSHGPFQTHVVALAYFLLGDSDAASRVPAVLFNLATIGFIWFYRRYLGRAGTLFAMLFATISPYLLFYGRYVRNEAYAAFAGVVMLWAILRYLETGKDKYTIWLTLATVLHFTAKETSFIYQAQGLLFLGFYFIYRLSRMRWTHAEMRWPFVGALVASLAFLGIAGGFTLLGQQVGILGAAETAAPAVPGTALPNLPLQAPSILVIAPLILGLLAVVAGIVFLVWGITWKELRKERSFSLLVLMTTMVLPMLSAFMVFMVGWNVPTNASAVTALTSVDILHIAVFLVPMTLLAIAIGLLWNPKLWLVNAAVFYAFFTVFYTTLFTNGAGFFTGLVGSLGYWLKQQEVNRGNQPWYYYVLVQIPVYEYLPAIASALGVALFAFAKRPVTRFTESCQAYLAQQKQLELAAQGVDAPANLAPEVVNTSISAMEDSAGGLDLTGSTPDKASVSSTSLAAETVKLDVAEQPAVVLEPAPVLPLLIFWVISSIAAYSIAGEKMPWLTVHIAWPMVLLGGWALGYVADTTDWSAFKRWRGWLVVLVMAVFLLSLGAMLGSLLGTNRPFQGQSLDQLQATSTFVTSFLVALGSGFGLWKLAKPWSPGQLVKLFFWAVFAGMALLTFRTAYSANFINYDNANELLVYAHSAGGVKEVMRQVEEISQRTTGGQQAIVGFDGEYPFWWYLRQFPNARYFGSSPTRSLREAPVIIVGDTNFDKIEPVVGQAYEYQEYIRLWWPNQDYFNLTWERIRTAFTDPLMREALFDVWLNRDYTRYGQVTGKDMSLENWSPSTRMRLYVRKDVARLIWEYGSATMSEEVAADPYEGKGVVLAADQVIGSAGAQPGQFNRPRDLEVAPDGSLFVVDTDNNRIQHIERDGQVIKTWGSYGDLTTGQAPGGTFNQPWGIAIGPDNSVYVTDTWNHRVQKFTLNGEFVTMWGYFGQAEKPDAFWGPRDVAVDPQGRVYVSDTGNKRVVVFDSNGNYLTQFGTAGLEAGQFDEPVGLAVDSDGFVYVADTWNQRIQVFQEASGAFGPVAEWEVVGWYGQSLDNKPFIAADANGNIFAVDPEGYRVLQFTSQGEFIRYWGDFGNGLDTFGLVGSVAADPAGGVWVSDTGNSRLMHFTLPVP